jgi:long-chain acyl-CoA synthetase
LTLKIFELHLKYAADPEHTALKYNQLKVSYAELENQVEHYARYIVHLGLKPGDRVAIALPNCPEFIYSYLGITRAGGVAVPLNLLQSPRELAFMLKDAGTNFLITSEAIGRQLQQLPGLSLTPVILDKACREQISSASPAAFPAICPDTVCTFLYTSGTTGQPKAVMLTHANLVANVIAMDNVSDFDRDDNFLAVLPMFHSFGWATSVLLPLYLGCGITILDRFMPKEVLQVLAEEKVTVFCGVPSMFSLMLKLRRTLPFPRLRYAFSGGDSIPPEHLREFENKFKIPVIEGYGLSEASPLVSLNPIKGLRKAKSIGIPLPGVEVRIIDEENRDLPPGEVGELLVKGPNVMHGYYNRKEETADTLKDGWLHTGDLGYRDPECYLYLVGRKKELIITAGLNVYPKEVEEALEEFPAVAEAAVIGVPHPVKGEVIKAYIRPEEGQKPDRQELLRFLRNRLANYKIPEAIVFTGDLPRGASGKILKRLLK